MKIQDYLGYAVNTSARLMKRSLDAELKAFDITSSQWAILKLLSQENNLSQAEIAEKTNSDRATCGSVIEKLVSKGFVTKDLSKNDRRSYIVRISARALDVLEEISLKADKVNQMAVKGLSQDELETLHKCLHLMISNLESGGTDDDNYNVANDDIRNR